MNENLNNSLAAIIERSLSALDSAMTFLQAEIPDVIHQLLLWHLAYSMIMFVIGLLIIGGLIYIWIKYSGPGCLLKEANNWQTAKYKITLTHGSDGKFSEHVMGSIFVTILPVSLAIIEFLNLEWLQILIAPKVWLIEYAARLIK